MESVQRLKARYGGYVRELEKRISEASPTDGLFGMGDDPRRDPCHMRFYEDVACWGREFLTEDPEQEAVFEAVKFLLEAPADHRDRACYWFMYAAQGTACPLIPRLSPKQRAFLRERYDRMYPRRDRMPVQKEVYRLLAKDDAGTGLWGFFRKRL